MKHVRRIFRVPSRWRWVIWPAVVAGSGGTAAVLWQEETIAMAECAPIVALPGLASLLYWFNHLIFRATKPRSEDRTDKITLKEDHL